MIKKFEKEVIEKKPYVSIFVAIHFLENRDIVTLSDSLADNDIVNDDIFG
jgi:hypothetical protein